MVKCSTADADQSHIKVIHSLHNTAGFRESDSWELKWWECTLLIKVKAAAGAEEYVVKKFRLPYLVHKDRHDVSAQNRAWMDTAALAMWIDLVIAPWMLQQGCRPWGLLILWDNCGPHCTHTVQ